jgi:hypothetical protein
MTVEKQCTKLRRVLDFLRQYQKGLSVTDRRLARNALSKQVLFLEKQRGVRVSRGPADQRRKAGTCELSGWQKAERRDGPDRVGG